MSTATGNSHSPNVSYCIALLASIFVFISTIAIAIYACIRFNACCAYDMDRRRRDQSGGYTVDHVVVVIGLDRPEIESFPKIVVGESVRLPESYNGTCSICLADYKPKEELRRIPLCNHLFHATCVDEWLTKQPTCPLCRNSPSSKMAPAPLSQVVPLPLGDR